MDKKHDVLFVSYIKNGSISCIVAKGLMVGEFGVNGICQHEQLFVFVLVQINNASINYSMIKH